MNLRERMKRVLSRTPASAFPQTSSSRSPPQPPPKKAQRAERSKTTDYSWISKEPSPSQYNRSRDITSAHSSSQQQPGFRPFPFTRRSKRTTDEWPKIELYKEHEIPRPKYRGPVDKMHAAKLAAYSISDASKERPRSIISEISPTATRAPPSRRNSVMHDHYQPVKREQSWAFKSHYSSGSNTSADIESPPSLRHYHGHERESDTSSSLTHYGMRDNVSSSTMLTSDIDEYPHLQRQHPGLKDAETDNAQPALVSSSAEPFDADELNDALNAIRLNLIL